VIKCRELSCAQLIQRNVERIFRHIECKFENVVVFTIKRIRDVHMFNFYVPPISSPFHDSVHEVGSVDIVEKYIVQFFWVGISTPEQVRQALVLSTISTMCA